MEDDITCGRHPYIRAFAVVLAVLAFVLSLSFYMRGHDKVRRLMYFPSYDAGGVCCEPRYLPKYVDEQLSLSAFVDELLLGPMTNRYGRVFPRGTKAEYCFAGDDGQGGKTLYVGLSRDALFAGELLSVREEVDLLRLNIVKNFTYLNKIDVAIDGVSVYEE